ncbi:cytadherence high molecular weight protein 2-like [Pleurodeles waltl]|uniref:cytadherence high molecular weight protein 2-like n=1 Tax=Pleurodeles waltl TaxID=8319 RepID=UPI003709B7DD
MEEPTAKNYKILNEILELHQYEITQRKACKLRRDELDYKNENSEWKITKLQTEIAELETDINNMNIEEPTAKNYKILNEILELHQYEITQRKARKLRRDELDYKNENSERKITKLQTEIAELETDINNMNIEEPTAKNYKILNEILELHQYEITQRKARKLRRDELDYKNENSESKITKLQTEIAELETDINNMNKEEPTTKNYKILNEILELHQYEITQRKARKLRRDELDYKNENSERKITKLQTEIAELETDINNMNMEEPTAKNYTILNEILELHQYEITQRKAHKLRRDELDYKNETDINNMNMEEPTAKNYKILNEILELHQYEITQRKARKLRRDELDYKNENSESKITKLQTEIAELETDINNMNKEEPTTKNYKILNEILELHQYEITQRKARKLRRDELDYKNENSERKITKLQTEIAELETDINNMNMEEPTAKNYTILNEILELHQYEITQRKAHKLRRDELDYKNETDINNMNMEEPTAKNYKILNEILELHQYEITQRKARKLRRDELDYKNETDINNMNMEEPTAKNYKILNEILELHQYEITQRKARKLRRDELDYKNETDINNMNMEEPTAKNYKILNEILELHQYEITQRKARKLRRDELDYKNETDINNMNMEEPTAKNYKILNEILELHQYEITQRKARKLRRDELDYKNETDINNMNMEEPTAKNYKILNEILELHQYEITQRKARKLRRDELDYKNETDINNMNMEEPTAKNYKILNEILELHQYEITQRKARKLRRDELDYKNENSERKITKLQTEIAQLETDINNMNMEEPTAKNYKILNGILELHQYEITKRKARKLRRDELDCKNETDINNMNMEEPTAKNYKILNEILELHQYEITQRKARKLRRDELDYKNENSERKITKLQTEIAELETDINNMNMKEPTAKNYKILNEILELHQYEITQRKARNLRRDELDYKNENSERKITKLQTEIAQLETDINNMNMEEPTAKNYKILNGILELHQYEITKRKARKLRRDELDCKNETDINNMNMEEPTAKNYKILNEILELHQYEITQRKARKLRRDELDYKNENSERKITKLQTEIAELETDINNMNMEEPTAKNYQILNEILELHQYEITQRKVRKLRRDELDYKNVLNLEEEEHNCATCTLNECSQAIEETIPDSTVYFVDGSSAIDQETGMRHTEAAVVRAQRHSSLDTLQVIEQSPLLIHYSVQAAELTALIAALKSGT